MLVDCRRHIPCDRVLLGDVGAWGWVLNQRVCQPVELWEASKRLAVAPHDVLPCAIDNYPFAVLRIYPSGEINC
jgi:hypothetical protein